MLSMIAVKNVSKSYGKKQVLSAVSLRIDPGSCFGIIGESGSGKTTLMRLLIRAEDPTDGAVEVDGVNIRTVPAPILQLYRRRVGIVFQEPILLEHTTVEENIALPLELLGAPNALISRNTTDLMKRLNLSAKAKLLPEDLSVSERSLVCIARAIITAPVVIIADDPVHNLDNAQKEIVRELFTNMHKKGTTVILFSRNTDFAHSMHAQIIELKDGKMGNQHAPEKTKGKTPEAHKLLEEEQEIVLPTSADEPKTPPPESGGKKIRITSIGSN